MIDLRSDTVTQPDEGMLAAMTSAPLGDDVLGDDPTVKLLESRTAAYFGMEAGLFFPSGTMANQVAIKTHVQPGDEVICDQTAHVYRYEGGGIAANSGASVRLLHGARGIFHEEDVALNVNGEDDHFPRTRLVCIENTVNKGGGACWPADRVAQISAFVKSKSIPLHLDGARLWNALVAGNKDPLFYGKMFDSISVCFSKGLGCPVGSVLLGGRDFLYEAKRHRKRMGGGMRQSGVLAAAAVYALDHNIARLKDDHAHCKMIASVLQNQSWVVEVMPPETNILLFRVESADKATTLTDLLKNYEIAALTTGGGWIRFVFHLGINATDVNRLCEVLGSLEIL